MTKPADIPQGVWDAAMAFDSGLFSGHRGLYVDDAARLIMAERERCAKLAEGWSVPTQPMHERTKVWRTWEISDAIAAAIRADGQP